MTYARVQGRDALVKHFSATRFPDGSPEFSPLVFMEPEGGQAPGSAVPHPLTIQQYLERTSGESEGADGQEGEGAREGGEAAPTAQGDA